MTPDRTDTADNAHECQLNCRRWYPIYLPPNEVIPDPVHPAKSRIIAYSPRTSHAPLPHANSSQILNPIHLPHAATRFLNRFGSRSNTRYRRLPRPLSNLFSDHDRRIWGSGSEKCEACSWGAWRSVGELERGRVDLVSGWASMVLMRCGEAGRMSRMSSLLGMMRYCWMVCTGYVISLMYDGYYGG